MRREDIDSVLEQLAAAGWEAGECHSVEKIAGGVHDAHRLRFEQADIFLKTTRLENAAMLDNEAEGVSRLRACGAVLMPGVLLNGVAGEIAYLALKWLDLAPATPEAQQRLGHMLAELHRSEADRYGWSRDNHIGLLRQSNTWSDNWCEFFCEQRLEFQLRVAEQRGNSEWLQQGFRLLDRLPTILEGYQPPASMLHGDLWSGNVAMRADGEPVVFDPAPYHGDRETDLAMTELFGGFTPAFYAAYEKAWPLDDGYEDRRAVYQLYHVINHVNMFGGGYEKQAERMIGGLLAKFT